jgi:hypothetical protein
MKKFLLLLSIVLITSCNNSDDSNSTPSIDGAFRLSNVRGGIAGTDDDFNDGSITWTFENNGTITVWNTNTDDSKQDLIESGTYVYTFQPNTVTPETCTTALYIDGVSYGCFTLNGDTLTLSQVENDGYEVTLIKLNPVID